MGIFKLLCTKANQKILIKTILDFPAFLLGHITWQRFLKVEPIIKVEEMKIT